MIALFAFTVRQILVQRKLLMALLVLLFPSALLILIRLVERQPSSEMLWLRYHGPMQFVLFMIVIPLVCMLYGTAMVGGEVEARTFIYLSTRRLRRSTLLAVRFLATALVICSLAGGAILTLHYCALGGLNIEESTIRLARDVGVGMRSQIVTWDPQHDLVSYLRVMPLAVVTFLALFTTLSLITMRPLTIAMVYTVLFELVLGNLPIPARKLTITHQLRLSLLEYMPDLRRIYGLNFEMTMKFFPAGESGTTDLLIVTAALLVAGCAIISLRELQPPKLAKE